jgi:hypothetical protein
MIFIEKNGKSFTAETQRPQRRAEENKKRLFSAFLRGLCISAVSCCPCDRRSRR